MIERTNADWLEELGGPEPAEAISDLRAILLRGLRVALANRLVGNLDSILEDFVQDALIKILDNLGSFRGESRFTTWAQKITINVAFTELRRRRWKNVSLQDLVDRYDSVDFTPAVLTDRQASPEQKATLKILMEKINQVIQEELTPKQREAMTAIVIGGMPLEEVARRMDTNRNALYKLLHDARKRLKQRLVQQGISPEEVLSIFEEQ